METCVLIPQEFSLCVRGPAIGRTEPEVSVWSNSMIAQGSHCYPFQGTIRLDKLEVYGQLDDDDVSESLFYFFLRFVFGKTRESLSLSRWSGCVPLWPGIH